MALNFEHIFLFQLRITKDINELELPKTCKTEFPDPGKHLLTLFNDSRVLNDGPWNNRTILIMDTLVSGIQIIRYSGAHFQEK